MGVSSATKTRCEIPLVTVIDADAAFRDSLSCLLSSAGWVPRTFASAQEFLACPRVITPGCLIVDATLPDLSGLELQQRVADRVELPVIMLMHQKDVFTTVRAMKAGAVEVLTKPVDSGTLLGAACTAIEHSSARIARETQQRTLRELYSTLSLREQEVMARVAAGYPNKQVAAELSISEVTVKVHRGRAMRKMQAKSLAHLVGMAAELRLAVPSRVTADVGSWRTLFPDPSLLHLTRQGAALL